MQTRSCDISVISAGSGGFAAAVAASRNRASVLRIEAAEGVGENYTWAGANNYEAADLDQIMR